jgi:hypothetical protein
VACRDQAREFFEPNCGSSLILRMYCRLFVNLNLGWLPHACKAAKSTSRRFYVQVDWICKHWPTFR